jgi:phenylpropionate dioxygenase-like ring-hydroxylating dioxygenase large terminal subunit
MSNLASAEHLRRATSQLPVSWYCDPAVFEVEQRQLFARGPGYVGHELMVPNAGDYHALSWRDDAQVLVRNAQGIELLSNICRHRQAIMLKGRGNARNIVCPIHRWTYDLKGELLGAPHFPDKPCLNLGRSPLQNWNGLLFDGQRDVAADLARIDVTGEFDFSNHVLDRGRDPRVQLQLEELHRGLPRGLPRAAVPSRARPVRHVQRLRWQFGDWIRCRPSASTTARQAGTKTYERWHKAVLDYYRGEMPQHGAIWMVYYPNVMLEWYPHVLVVSTLIPRAVDRTTNIVEFYYPEDIALFEREFVEAEQAAYLETRAKTTRSPSGWTPAATRSTARRSEEGPYQSPMEDGMQHFHEILRRELIPHLHAR